LTCVLSFMSIFICSLLLNAYDSWAKGQNQKCQYGRRCPFVCSCCNSPLTRELRRGRIRVPTILLLVCVKGVLLLRGERPLLCDNILLFEFCNEAVYGVATSPKTLTFYPLIAQFLNGVRLLWPMGFHLVHLLLC